MTSLITPSVPLAAVIALGYLATALLLARRWSAAGTSRRPATVALGLVVVLVLVLTGAGYHPHPGVRPVELVPLAGLARHTATELIGNLALLAPFGAFGGLLLQGRPMLVTAAAAALSAAVEGFQYLAASGRVASVDYVLLNTLGAALGLAGARLVRHS